MVKKFYLAAIVAAFAAVGCSEMKEELASDASMTTGEKVLLTVRIPQVSTKVTGASNDDAVGDIQVFVFNKNGAYETSSYGNGAALSLTCTTGEKQIVALVNAPLETGVNNIGELRARTSDLVDCSEGSIVMAGEVTKVLEASSTVTMVVERLAAKVAVSQVKTDFVLEQHQALQFEIKAIYLVNAAGQRSYLVDNTPSKWYNLGMCDASTAPAFLYDEVTSGVIENGSSYDIEHYFYCYPNATTTKTRLVVEAQVGDYLYYYPLTLDRVDPNTAYTYNLTITRLGSDSPDKPVEEGTVQFNVTVKEWTEQNVEEII